MTNRSGKAELVDAVSSKTGITKKDASAAIDALVEAVLAHAKKGTVTIPGLGGFSVIKTKARTGVKPGTSEKIKIAAGKRLKFKASSTVKAAI